MSERVRRYGEAMKSMDFKTLGELRHADYECVYPQSGERFVGHDRWVAAHENYHARFGATPEFEEVKGDERRAKVTTAISPIPFASTPIIQLSDTGDLVTVEGAGCWPDGKIYHWVQILEFRDGLVWRETQYFAEPFEAPEWRAEFTAGPD